MTKRSAVLAVLVLVAGCGCGGGTDAAHAPRHSGGVTLVAVGDIARCSSGQDEATARLAAAHPRATIATLGDNAYPKGLKDQFEHCYAPSWGRFKQRTRPTPGNHEYLYFNKDAAAYFDYFGDAAGPYGIGYYSYELGAWHVIALNSNCDAETLKGCGSESPQVRWLRDDLSKTTKACTLAYWHHPRLSSGSEHETREFVEPLWDVLADDDADVVLNAHEHNYQRFAPQNGIREFVVGTGGAELYPVGDPLPATEVQQGEAHGILVLTLYDGGYDWRFEPVAGQAFTDHGSGTCH